LKPVELQVLDAFPPPPREVTLTDLEERCPIPTDELLETVWTLMLADLVSARFRYGEHSQLECEELRLRRWQVRILQRLPSRLAYGILLAIRRVELNRALLIFRISNEGLKKRFEERKGQPFGRQVPEFDG